MIPLWIVVGELRCGVAGVDLLKHPVVSVAVGTTAIAVGGADALYRAVERLPIVGSWMRRGVNKSISCRSAAITWITHNIDPFKARSSRASPRAKFTSGKSCPGPVRG
jgi:hypothetical protein